MANGIACSARLLSLAALLLVPTAGCRHHLPTDPMSHLNDLPPSLEQKVQLLRADLEKHGYQVARGYWTLFSMADCQYAIERAGSCYANNPTAPYILLALPPWKDEYVDSLLHDLFKPLQGNMSATYRLDAREALVILGELPPPAHYFGIQTNVYSREGSINPAHPVYRSLASTPDVQAMLFTYSPDPARVLVFSSIGNAINHKVIEAQSGPAFGQERYFISTPDAVMARAMTKALGRVGVKANAVFTEPVAPRLANVGLVNVGLGRSADDMTMIIRYAMPEDSAAGEQWRQRLPFAVLRVRDRDVTRATEPYPTPAYDARDAAAEDSLRNDHALLVDAVKALWRQPAALDTPFVNSYQQVRLLGQLCLTPGFPMNCLADTQDTDTYRTSPGAWIDAGQVIAVVGTLAQATGNATYVSLGVNRAAVLMAVANISDEELAGSASAFKGKVDHTDSLYVYYFARDCTGLSHCRALPESVVLKGEMIKFMQRNYMRPNTQRGADPNQLLNPVMIVLNGSTRPAP